jgi:hypothetical protein
MPKLCVNNYGINNYGVKNKRCVMFKKALFHAKSGRRWLAVEQQLGLWLAVGCSLFE